jgi:hypothetical protein
LTCALLCLSLCQLKSAPQSHIGLECVSERAQNVGLPSGTITEGNHEQRIHRWVSPVCLRYPVKSMMGEELTAAEVRESGLIGDVPALSRAYPETPWERVVRIKMSTERHPGLEVWRDDSLLQRAK